MSGPNLHVFTKDTIYRGALVFTLKFLVLKNCFFASSRSNNFLILVYEKGIMQLFSADAKVFSKRF